MFCRHATSSVEDRTCLLYRVPEAAGDAVGVQAVQETVPGWLTVVAPTPTRSESVQIDRGMADKEVHVPPQPYPLCSCVHAYLHLPTCPIKEMQGLHAQAPNACPRANALLLLKGRCRSEQLHSSASLVSVAGEGRMCRMTLLHHCSFEVLSHRYQQNSASTEAANAALLYSL